MCRSVRRSRIRVLPVVRHVRDAVAPDRYVFGSGVNLVSGAHTNARKMIET